MSADISISNSKKAHYSGIADYYKLFSSINSSNIQYSTVDFKIINNLTISKYNIKDHTLSANIGKFLGFLKALNITGIETLNKDIHIVSHSHAMQLFLGQLLSKKDITENNYIFKDNLWSVELPFSSSALTSRNSVPTHKKIIITRHGYSIANFMQDSYKGISKNITNKHGKVAGKIAKFRYALSSKYNQVTELDPGLTLYGIITAIIRGKKIKEQVASDTNINTIYVSNLLRTWMTAVCLYLPHITAESNQFNLIISPNINEEGSTRNNKPDEITKQIMKFLKFLNVLKEITKTNNNILPFFIKDGVINLIRYQALVNPKKENHYTVSFINGKFVCKPNITLTIELKNPTIQVAGGLFDFFKKLKTTRQEHTTSTNIIKKNESITLYSGICKPFNDILQRMTVYCEPLSSYFNYFECSNGYGKLGNKQRLPPTKLECKIKTQKGGKRRFTRRKTRKLK